MNMNMLIFIRNLKDIEVTVEGKKRTIQQADLNIRFRSFVFKDYESKWERRPILFFLRVWADRFIYKTHLNRFAEELVNDTKLLQSNIKGFLNLYQRR